MRNILNTRIVAVGKQDFNCKKTGKQTGIIRYFPAVRLQYEIFCITVLHGLKPCKLFYLCHAEFRTFRNFLNSQLSHF